MQKIAVRSQIFSASAREFPLLDVAFDGTSEIMTVAALIKHTVEEQFRTLLMTNTVEMEQAYRILDQQYPVRKELDRVPEEEDLHAPCERITAIVNKAWHAFERRTYLVIVDGKIAQRLDEEFTFRASSKVIFIRLTPLVGG